MDVQKCNNYINKVWNNSIISTLENYIRIPNKSPIFDANWQKNGYMAQAVELIKCWCENNAPNGMELKVLQINNRTPLIYIDINGDPSRNTILLYGHLDKQPEMTGWDNNFGPWKPVIMNNKLYGRGGADDGYAIFSAITAINALQDQNIPHGRCIIIIEASEESGSIDLPLYITELESSIGKPDLIICLDSGCGNYEQMWVTTSLRGIVGGRLKVQVTEQGIHSGIASGVVPCSFRIARKLLSRIENEDTGKIILPELQVEIPNDRLKEAEETAKVLQNNIYHELPFVHDARPITEDLVELVLNKTWRSFLSIIGIDGIPSIDAAGNVHRTYTELKLSIRIPPILEANDAAEAIKNKLEYAPPYNALVNYDIEDVASGWNAPKTEEWVHLVADDASKMFFGKEVQYIGEGGTIPFMGMLGEMFPDAQFIITGVLGPKSNAHGPNEFLHLSYVEKLTGSIAYIIGNYHKKQP